MCQTLWPELHGLNSTLFVTSILIVTWLHEDLCSPLSNNYVQARPRVQEDYERVTPVWRLARAQFQGCICVDGVVLTPWKSFSGVFVFEIRKLDARCAVLLL